MSIDSQILSDRARAEAARLVAESARDESQGVLDEILEQNDYGSITDTAVSFIDYGLITE